MPTQSGTTFLSRVCVSVPSAFAQLRAPENGSTLTAADGREAPLTCPYRDRLRPGTGPVEAK
ncbi:hypothetical protein GCM10027598_70390 [Amycolatopsis oliviviridis]|uniref:Uncharacterized protein n=1 Tax=Amycolatopsis oliviviridis TaxID=1471590 RepID=A0ABQ3L2G5_9PSEU|nr:hypothetical protein GCM10017790_00310 [Amycolatopsis oliviviridis]